MQVAISMIGFTFFFDIFANLAIQTRLPLRQPS